MKKLLTWILVLTVLLSLSACGGRTTNTEESTSSGQTAEEIADVCKATGEYLYSGVQEPTFGAVGGEWLILGMARSNLDIPEEYFETYFQNLSAYTAQQGGVLHEKKYTEYSRVTLAVTAIDRDPTDVGGFDMLQPLSDFEQTVFQGINGPAFALLALDSGNYEIPETITDSTQATRNLYVDYIINAQLTEGGWTMMGSEAEADITAMVLQALAKYQDRKDVAEATQKALDVLSALQNESGGFGSGQMQSSEAVSQTIVALTELGISLDDSRFVKSGNTLMDALMQYRQEDGGFSHLPEGDSDLLATEQAFYALVAAARAAQGETSLYRIK